MRLQDVPHPDDLGHCFELLEQVTASGEVVVNEKLIVGKDGAEVWISYSVARVSAGLGTPPSIVIVSVDVNERRRAEAALKELNERDCKVVLGYDECQVAGTSGFSPYTAQAAVRSPVASQANVITFSLTPS